MCYILLDCCNSERWLLEMLRDFNPMKICFTYFTICFSYAERDDDGAVRSLIKDMVILYCMFLTDREEKFDNLSCSFWVKFSIHQKKPFLPIR